MAKKIYPFSNGTEYLAFLEGNCFNCSKEAKDYYSDSPCGIQNALFRAEEEDGSVSKEIAERVGYHKDGKRIPLGPIICTEFEAKKQKKGRKK